MNGKFKSILSNLKEVYYAFKDKYPNEKVGFSKFAELRPRHCVLAGASGTHSVCVCTIHQNVKLMVQGVKLSDLSATNLASYQHCLTRILCNPPSPILQLCTFFKSALLKRVIPAEQPFKKVIYFSDGAASQYKNRENFLNLCHHKEDFGISAEWHFSATSHGKGACDGLGGTVKRLAARVSLQRPYDQQIMTPRQLFDWATITVHFEYCTIEDYEREKHYLEERFQVSQTIHCTRKLHSFVPTSEDTLAVKSYSVSLTSKEVKVTSADSEIPLENISGFVTCAYQQNW